MATFMVNLSNPSSWEHSILTIDKESGKIVSDGMREWFEIVNFVFICTVIATFGIVSNVINIIVFLKQGLDNTMNISFFGLAISDLCSLLTLQWFDLSMNPLFYKSDIPIVPSEIQYLTAGWPHTTFGRITCWITAYVTAERCLCIAIPLKIKQIITPRRTTIILFIIYLLNIASVMPIYATTSFGWKYYPERNRTLLGLVFKGDKDTIERLVFLLHSVLGMTAFVSVALFTIFLVIKLRRKTKWRETATANSQQTESITNRDKRTIKLVAFISVILVTFYTPTAAFSMVTFFEPEVSVVGKYYNLFIVLWSFGFICEALNSSVNIFIYYRMSSKYRQTFNGIFTTCRSGEGEKP